MSTQKQQTTPTRNTARQGTIRPEHPHAKQLAKLQKLFKLTGNTTGAALVTGITIDSRDVRPGDIYVALEGARHHGAKFTNQAIQNGAVAIITDRDGNKLIGAEPRTRPAKHGGEPVAILQSPHPPRKTLGKLAAHIYNTETRTAPCYAVTGTNGKTSIIYMLAELARQAGYMPGLSSTAERRIGEQVVESSLTSPESTELHALIARMKECGVQQIAIEVSAQALIHGRLDGLLIDVAAFNNLSQDHLDDFADMENYYQAKRQLFTPAHAKQAVIVVDTPTGKRLARESEIPVTTLATTPGTPADWQLAVTARSLDGVRFALQGPTGEHFTGAVPILGDFMAENAALALIMLHKTGINIDKIKQNLDRGKIPVYIPGRMELMNKKETAALPRFYVDYGHTPGSFQALLEELTRVAPARTIFLFGGDGDRDTTKRTQMGEIAGTLADTVIVCDYNPRTENPAKIREQLLAGARNAKKADVHECEDPAAAIRLALKLANPEDIIVYAGPGHETHREIAGTFIPFSARAEVLKALEEARLQG